MVSSRDGTLGLAAEDVEMDSRCVDRRPLLMRGGAAWIEEAERKVAVQTPQHFLP